MEQEKLGQEAIDEALVAFTGTQGMGKGFRYCCPVVAAH